MSLQILATSVNAERVNLFPKEGLTTAPSFPIHVLDGVASLATSANPGDIAAPAAERRGG